MGCAVRARRAGLEPNVAQDSVRREKGIPVTDAFCGFLS